MSRRKDGRPRSMPTAAEPGALEPVIMELLTRRAQGSTTCPSEAARAVGGDDWRDLMEDARAAANRLVAAGEVDITQGGEIVDGESVRGPIRIRRRVDRAETDDDVSDT